MKLWLLKLEVSVGAVAKVLTKPAYAALALVVAAITLAIVLWTFNISLLRFVLFESGLPVWERLSFLAGTYGAIATNFESGLAITLVLFSLLFGINMAALVYVL